MPVRLCDIAKELGYSHATISFALNDNYNVKLSESTRQRVKETAKRMGYVPNAAARALVKGTPLEDEALHLVNDAIDAVIDDPDRAGMVLLPRYALAYLEEAADRRWWPLPPTPSTPKEERS